MGYKQQCSAALTNRARQQPHHTFCALFIKIPRRLVSKEKRRVIGQCSGDSDSLLFSPAELGRIVVAAISQADEIEKFAKAVTGIFDRHDASAPRDPGRVTMRRLNRAEYNNPIRDLFFGLDARPADDVRRMEVAT